MKKKTPKQKRTELNNNILTEIARWNHYQQYGGQDPFWSDGVNMNLIRNHIISYKHELIELCADNSLDIPDAYYMATPPVVDDGYMAANPENQYRKVRTKRIEQMGTTVTHKKVEYDPMQMSLF